MNRSLIPLLVCFLTTLGPVSSAEPTLPDQATLLQALNREHPRILASRADFERIAARCQADERAGRWLERLREQADKLLDDPPVRYEIPDGKRLLAVSRTAKDRLLLLGLLYQLSGDRKYSERAWKELDAVQNFKDWNPSHFLDTAEMTFAVSIGYDWLYHAWSEPQRTQLREAIVRKGFKPGLAVYRKQQGWTQSKHNWNQVCNGGMGVGALAIGDQEPVLSAEVLHSALRSLPLAMREFAPDGGWGEGPGYWRYATEYNVYLLAALQSALGTDFGLSRMTGFSQAGDFPLHFVGPTGMSFNFADAHDGWSGAPQLFWLASQYHTPAYAQSQRLKAESRPSPLDLVWGANWTSTTTEEKTATLPLGRHFRGVSVVTLRSAWNDPDALFVAFKGGDNRVNHGHLDLGTFVLDALGHRWGIDLGPDDYNLPGYFGAQRWKYFRNNTQSHNTLLIDGQNQSTTARAEVLRFFADDKWMGGVVDLSAAWPQVKHARRGVALVERRRVLVQDEVASAEPVSVTWQMLTEARIDLDGKAAILTIGDRKLRATLMAPPTSRWKSVEVQVARPERSVNNVRKLLVESDLPTTDLRTAVVFDVESSLAAMPELIPLDQWPTETK